jgi:hypothetical protein
VRGFEHEPLAQAGGFLFRRATLRNHSAIPKTTSKLGFDTSIVRTDTGTSVSKSGPDSRFGAYTGLVRTLMSGSTAKGEIIRWEILPGLPGEGPTPRYYHVRHPTPWAEGLVVRFWRADGSEWVGNFQGLQDWSWKVMLWPEADSAIVVAMDNLYLVDAGNPNSYVTADSQLLVDDIMLDDEHHMLFVAASTTVLAFGRDRRLLWSRSELGGYDAQFQTCASGVLTLEVEEELGGQRKTIRLSAKDGAGL